MEKALFRRLATFVDGGTVDAIEAVCAVTGADNTLDVLESLVAQSLLQQIAVAGDEPRFRMLSTIREFAGEELAASGEAEVVRRRHAEFYLGLAERTRDDWARPEQGERRRRLERDHDNLRTAVSWAQGNDGALARRLADALAWFDRVLVEAYQDDAAVGDYERQLAAARATGDPHAEARALLGLVRAHHGLSLDDQTHGAIEKSRASFDVGVALAREIGDTPTLVRLLSQSCWFASAWSEYRPQAEANAREAMALSEASGDEALIVEASLVGWGLLPRAEAERHGDELTRTLLARCDHVGLNRHYFNAMWRYLFWGRFARTIELADAATRLAATLGIPPVQYGTIKAWALLGLGRYGDAWRALQQEVADDAHPFGRAYRDLGLATYFYELGADEQALATFREVEAQAGRLRRGWMQELARIGQAVALIRLGRLADAEVLEQPDETFRAGMPALPDVRAELALAEDHGEEALERADMLARSAEERGSPPAALLARETQARALLRLDRPDDALAIADAALVIAGEIGSLPMAATSWRSRRRPSPSSADQPMRL